MKIEVLYPEVGNLYGDLANIKYMVRSANESGLNTEVVSTHLNDVPEFISANSDVDMVYMGTMTESSQLIVLDRLRKYKNEIRSCIEDGIHFLITGNALEVFGNKIDDADGEHIDCLGLYNFHTTRDMFGRYSCGFTGKFGSMGITGHKSQFTQSFYDDEYTPVFSVDKGYGFNKNDSKEGIHDKNFICTYLLGPLLISNPPFMTALVKDITGAEIHPSFENAAIEAYEARLKNYNRPGRGLIY